MKIYSLAVQVLLGLLISFQSLQTSSHSEITPQIISGAVEGTAVLAPKSRPARGGGLYGRPAPSSTQESSSDSILVVLKGSSGSISTASTMPVLNQKDQQFQPSILPVVVGETIRIQNSDPVYHNVFSLTSPHKFDVGRRPKGEHFDVQFEKSGIVDVFCDIHSNMHAIVYVLPSGTQAWRKIKSGDRFLFPDIKDGTYELTLFALGYQQTSISVVIRNGETYQAGTIILNP